MKRSKTISAECRLRIADCRRGVAGRRARAGTGAVVGGAPSALFLAGVAASPRGTRCVAPKRGTRLGTRRDGGTAGTSLAGVHFRSPCKASCGPEAQRALERRKYDALPSTSAGTALPYGNRDARQLQTAFDVLLSMPREALPDAAAKP